MFMELAYVGKSFFASEKVLWTRSRNWLCPQQGSLSSTPSVNKCWARKANVRLCNSTNQVIINGAGDSPQVDAEESSSTCAESEPVTVTEDRIAELESEALRKLVHTISQRRDAHVIGVGRAGRVKASLAYREPHRGVLVLVPTRTAAADASEEAQAAVNEQKRKGRVITVAGRGPATLQNPARSANSANNLHGGAVVVGTPRALVTYFLRDGQGPKWFESVSRLILYDLEWMYNIGCLKDVRRILKRIPLPEERQTIAISQGKSNETVNALTKASLRNCVDEIHWNSYETSSVEEKVAKIAQRFVRVPENDVLVVLAEVLQDIQKIRNHKAVVFFQAARLAQLHAGIFKEIGLRVEETHSRRRPTSQLLAIETFLEEDSIFLFTSEMTSSRATLPHVSHIVHVGAPSDPSQYLKRVSIGTPGACTSVLILPDYEADITLESLSEFVSLQPVNCYPSNNCRDAIVKTAHQAVSAMHWQIVSNAYIAWLSIHTTRRKRLGWTRDDLVRHSESWSLSTTGASPGLVPSRVADRLSLWGVQGVRVGEPKGNKITYMQQTGLLGVDRSLVLKKDDKVGIRGKNALRRRLKPKKLKIPDWREIYNELSKEDQKKLVAGKIDAAEVLIKAGKADPEKWGINSKSKKKASDLQKEPVLLGKPLPSRKKPRKEKRIRLRVEEWAPSFPKIDRESADSFHSGMV